MRRRFGLLAILVAILPLQNQGQSIKPFYEPQDVVFKTELLGKWNLEGITVEFHDAGDQAYGIILRGDDGNDMYFRAHLIHLRGKYFLDAQVTGIETSDTKKEEKQGGERKGEIANDCFNVKSDDILLNRHHGLILLEFSSDSDRFTGFIWREKWLDEMAQQGKLKIGYVKDEFGRILLTGESTQLRSFAAKLPKEAFGESRTLVRIKG